MKNNEYKIKFAKPYQFESKEYTEIDLSKIEDLSTRQLADATKQFSTSEYITPRPEADVNFCCIIAASVCSLPQQFFDDLPAKEGVKVRDVVQTFFQRED